MKSGERNQTITLLQALSCLSVVILHTNGCFWRYSTKRYWFTANIIESVFYFAVPLFFMITGATLMNYQERYDTKTFFKKRAAKTLIPYIAWSLIAIVYQVCTGKVSLHEVNVAFIGKRLIAGDAIGIYWFFPTLFCVYACIPLFASIPNEKREKLFLYLIGVGLLFNQVIPFIRNIVGYTFAYPYSISVVSGHLLYVILGSLLHDRKSLTHRLCAGIYVLGVVGLLLHIVGTYQLSRTAGSIVRTYKGYTNLPCVLYSVAIFVLFQTIGDRIMQNRIGGGLCTAVARYSFAIYLMHYFIMDTMVRWFHINTLSISYRLGAPFVIIPIVMLITSILRKIPVLKAIVP